MKLDDLAERARLSEGLNLLDLGIAMQKLAFRGSAFPKSTEAPAVDQALRDLVAAHFLATCSIPLWLKSCKRCKGGKPEDKELCDTCQSRLWDEEDQWRGEERDRQRFEFKQRMGW